MAAKIRAGDVFINCPFGASFKPVFEAIVFAIYGLGFVARCALEVDDGSQSRLNLILDLIESSAYGVHDISQVEIDTDTGLPHFNMALELGLFLGCKRFGGSAQRVKGCLVFDRDLSRFRDSVSDLAGQNIHAHGGEPDRAIGEVRNWLSSASKREGLLGGQAIADRYARFRAELPKLCATLMRQEDKLTFGDLSEMISLWLRANS